MDALDPQYLDAIKGFEGYQAQPYWDYKQSTSGYGTKAQPGDENIPPDQLKQVHEQRFSDEVGKAAASVDSFAPNIPSGTRAALTSLTYNAGPGWQNSGLGDAVKAGDWDRAQQLFLQYNKAGGAVNPGLVNRRQQEAAWFGGGLPQTAQASPASPSGAPLQIAQATPQFAAPQSPQQQAPQQDSGGQPLQIPQGAQAPPIYYAPRRQIDLSRLRAALSGPHLSRGS